MQLVQSPMVDATADEHGMTISTTGDIRLRIHAKGMDRTKIDANNWSLPGLRISVSSDKKSFRLEKEQDAIDLIYSGITGMRLTITPVQ